APRRAPARAPRRDRASLRSGPRPLAARAPALLDGARGSGPDRGFPVALGRVLIRPDGRGELLAAREAVTLHLPGLRLVEEISCELIRLGGEGLLTTPCRRRVRLIEAAPQARVVGGSSGPFCSTPRREARWPPRGAPPRHGRGPRGGAAPSSVPCSPRPYSTSPLRVGRRGHREERPGATSRKPRRRPR